MENFNIDAEKSILSAILTDNSLVEEIRIDATDFSEQRLRYIYRVMKHLYESGKKIDTISLIDYIQKAGKLDAIGGILFVTELDRYSPIVANAKQHAEIVRELSLRRKLLNFADTLKQRASDCIDAAEVVEEAQKKLLELGDVEDEDCPLPMDILARQYADELRLRQGNPVLGVMTGYEDLDRMTSGFKKGNFIVLAARPAMGKTAFALNVAQNIARSEHVLFVSLEMSRDQLMDRMFRTEASVLNIGGYGSGSDFMRSIDKIEASLSKINIHIYDNSRMRISDVRKAARKIKHNYGNLGLIVIDYLQLMKSEGRFDSRVQEVSELTRSLKILARELEVPIMALSQLSRGVEVRDNKRPMLSDLRESGTIEQDADIVMMLYRDSYYNKEAEDKGTSELIINKHRSGPIGTVNLFYLFNNLRFVPMPAPQPKEKPDWVGGDDDGED